MGAATDTAVVEPDRDALIMIVAKAIHGDLIDFDNLEDYERADLVDMAIDVLDALALAGLVVLEARLRHDVVRSFASQGTD